MPSPALLRSGERKPASLHYLSFLMNALAQVVSIDVWRLMGMQQNERTVSGGEAHGGIYLIVSILLELG